MCHQASLPTQILALVLSIAVAGLGQASEQARRTVDVRPGEHASVALSPEEAELQIRWIGGKGPHLLLVEQIGADVILSRRNGLVSQNAPTGRKGPELALLDQSEIIQIARKISEPIAWRLDISSYPVSQREQPALQAIESAHLANSPGTEAGNKQALKALSKALALKHTLPKELALECPIRTGLGVLNRRANRRYKAVLAYQAANAVCTDAGWKASIENGIGLVYREEQKFDLARTHFQRARQLAMTANNPYEAASAVNNLCLVMQHDGALNEAKECYQRSIEDYRSAGLITHVADPLVNLGATAVSLGEPDLALKSFQDAVAIRRQGNEQLKLANALCNLARAQAATDALQAALKSIDEAKWRAEAVGNADAIANAILIRADVHRQTGDNVALARDVRELLDVSKNGQNPRTEAWAWMLQASLMPAQEALLLQHKAERIWRKTKQPVSRSEALLAISQTEKSLGRLESARKAATKALRIARTHRVQAISADALQELAHLGRSRDPETALRYAREAATINNALGRVVDQTENQFLGALILRDLGQNDAAANALADAASLSVRALTQPLSQRHRRLLAVRAVQILSTWTDWVIADQPHGNAPTDEALAPLTGLWSRVNQWRNQTDRLDRKATAQLAEWRAKLLALRQPDLSEQTRANLQARIRWLEQQMDLLGNAASPGPLTATPGAEPEYQPRAANEDAVVWVLPGEDHVYAVVQHRNTRQILRLPPMATIHTWQERIRENPDKLSLWSELDEKLATLRQALGPARDVLVFDPEMLAIPWLGLVSDAKGEMLIEHRSIRYLQAWTGTEPPPITLKPVRLGWPSLQSDQPDPERHALELALPDLPIDDDLIAGQQPGAWILQIPGHHEIDQNDLAQAVSLSAGGAASLFGPERLDQYQTPPKLVFLNACRGHSGMSGLGLLDLIARPGVSAAIINAWDVPDAPAARFAVQFYQQLAATPDHPAEALSRAQTEFAKRGGRRLLKEWAGYVLVELAVSDTSGPGLRD